jgi:hypothetical protein
VAGQKEIASIHKAGTFFEGVPEDQVCSDDLHPADRVEINSLPRLFVTTQQPGLGTT